MYSDMPISYTGAPNEYQLQVVFNVGSEGKIEGCKPTTGGVAAYFCV